MSLPPILKHPFVLALIGVMLAGFGYAAAIQSNAPHNPCAKTPQQMTFTGNGLVAVGDNGQICAYDLSQKKWLLLEMPSSPAPTAPAPATP